MKISPILVWSATLSVYYAQSATLTLRIRSYPDAHRTVKKLKKAGNIAKQHLNGLGTANSSPIVGIFATYAGYLEASNVHGDIIFTRKHNQPKLNLLITPQITPVVMFEQTIQNWQLIPTVQAQLYTIERETDENTQLTYWNVQEKELPEDNTIPLETIIIIAKPKHMVMPTGITLTDTSTNLVLPHVYTRKGIDIVGNSLYILNLSHLFGQVHVMHDKKETRYALQPTD